MKKSSNTIFTIIIITIMGLFACHTGNIYNIKNATFTSEEMRFVQPFKKDTVIVYKSAQGQVDTIKFFKARIDTIKHRSFELGYFNENALVVGFEPTVNSFHKITVHSIDKHPPYFLLFLKKDSSCIAREVGFLGLLFDENYVNRILNTKDNQIIFNGKNAQYTEQNTNIGIKSFTFDFKKGITSFIDGDGVEWVRSK